MAVLIEAISAVIRADALLKAFDNDWESSKLLCQIRHYAPIMKLSGLDS